MIDAKITLSPEERRQLVATRETLTRIQEKQNLNGPTEGAICGLEMILEWSCPHNPELHTLRDIRHGWEVTCHDCEASWKHIDDTALMGR